MKHKTIQIFLPDYSLGIMNKLSCHTVRGSAAERVIRKMMDFVEIFISGMTT